MHPFQSGKSSNLVLNDYCPSLCVALCFHDVYNKRTTQVGIHQTPQLYVELLSLISKTQIVIEVIQHCMVETTASTCYTHYTELEIQPPEGLNF